LIINFEKNISKSFFILLLQPSLYLPVKSIVYFVITVVLFIPFSFSLNAQNTQGKDFWLTFGKNNNFFATNADLKIHIASGGKFTTGSIYFTHLGTLQEFEIEPQTVFTYTLTTAQKQAAYNTVMGITAFSIRIETDNPVTVYAMNVANAFMDATNILPVSTLGSKYRQISYTPYCFYFQVLDAYAVIATENGTTVEHNGGEPQTLNKGQVYYRTSATDMTGALITSTKPIAFFALNQTAQVPNGYEYGDPLIQQLAPVETWGTRFFVPVSSQGKNITRVVVSQDGTDINVPPGTTLLSPTGGQSTLTGLQAGQFVEFEVTVVNKGCYITSNKPVGVCTYLPSRAYTNSGDPAQCWLPALEQTTPAILIAPFVVPAYLTSHFALVSTPTVTKKNTKVSIGGALSDTLTGGIWVDNSTAGMSFYAMPLTNPSASYLIDNPAGVIVLCYGLGDYSSYYYLAGSAMRDLTAAFFVNDFHYLELPESFSCDDKIVFRAEIVGLSTIEGSLRWFINGQEEDDARDQLMWEKSLAKGVYDIEMRVRFENNDIVSYTSTLTVKGLWIKIKNVRY